jgi:hypothetical protein
VIEGNWQLVYRHESLDHDWRGRPAGFERPGGGASARELAVVMPRKRRLGGVAQSRRSGNAACRERERSTALALPHE